VTPLPKKDPKSNFNIMKGPEDLAKEHFGKAEGLLIVRAKKLELAEHYAKSYGLKMEDPDVATTATLLAWTRFREFSLIQASEKKIYEYVVERGVSYGDALFASIQSENQKRVLIEVRRLHDQARHLKKDLEDLSKD